MLADNHVDVVEFPVASFDLNPIENVSQLMKDILQPGNLAGWKDAIRETWLNPTYSAIESLIGSLARRMNQCIDRQGALTKYK